MIQIKVKLNEKDAQKLEDLTSKRTALENLVLIGENNPLVRNEQLYEKFLADYGTTRSEIDRQWEYIRDKYELDQTCDLYIDFQTRIVTNIKETD